MTNGTDHPTGDRLALFGERLDRLMTIEVRPTDGGLPAGIVVPTYLALRKHHGEPLSSLAARRLRVAVSQGDTVLIATGAGVAPNLPHGETDGPPGACVLARALAIGLGARVVVVTEQAHLGPVEACAELARTTLGDRGSIEVAVFPSGEDAGRLAASTLMSESHATAVIFVERDGPNEAGHFHGIRGDRRPAGTVAHAHLLAREAGERGILTIGVGDGGNEVGFGAVRREVSRLLPRDGRSKPDDTGVVTVVATDVTLSASVSNWGAYAISAALAVALGDANLVHRPEFERSLIAACVAAGAGTGPLPGRPWPWTESTGGATPRWSS